MFTRVWLDESVQECICCSKCEAMIPEVFEVPEKMVVRQYANLNLADAIKEAADECPVFTIAIEYEHSGKRENHIHAIRSLVM